MVMTSTVASLMNSLTPDPWRLEVGFSQDIEEANKVLFSPNINDSVAMMKEWLQKNQPCVFGRMAAKFGFIQYCILTEADLRLPDEAIEMKIQDARLQWIREAYDGKKSNLVVLAVSAAISYARPDQTVANIAQRLCSLYLRTEARFDFVHHDHIFLEKPGPSRTTWRWLAGVNYFSAQGDKRWWQDHRIPGGMGLSINSVGHLVKSEKIAHAMRELNEQLGISDEEVWNDSKVDSLEKALLLAMQTISNASPAVSGRATELLKVPKDLNWINLPDCPVELPSSLSDKNHCEYLGYYHTDYTLPSEYFRSDERRPQSIEPRLLDFTYLFRKHIDNPDHWTMGEGQRIRSNEKAFSEEPPINEADDYKRQRGRALSVPIESCELLVEALSLEDKTV
jgi:hypothetical protein